MQDDGRYAAVVLSGAYENIPGVIIAPAQFRHAPIVTNFLEQLKHYVLEFVEPMHWTLSSKGTTETHCPRAVCQVSILDS